MKIVILDAKTLGDVDLSGFHDLGDLEVFPMTNRDECAERIRDAEIVVTNKVVLDLDILTNGKKLKLICIAATGMNNIDLQAAKDLKIAVKNVTGYSTESVVRHTFSMYFHLTSHSSYYNHYAQNGEWSRSSIFTHLGPSLTELSGKLWGIIGMGAIGRRVAEVATAFVCRVNYFSTSGENTSQPYPHKELNQLLEESDIVSIHAPLNETTKNLINRKNLCLMKKEGVLMNLGRGGIINETDLAEALDLGRPALAGLDVLEKEPPGEDNPLFHIKYKERLLLTPHIAWTTKEARERLVKEIQNNIKIWMDEKGFNLKGESSSPTSS